jgi:dipeptidase
MAATDEPRKYDRRPETGMRYNNIPPITTHLGIHPETGGNIKDVGGAINLTCTVAAPKINSLISDGLANDLHNDLWRYSLDRGEDGLVRIKEFLDFPSLV